MNTAIETLQRRILAAFPGAVATLDRPDDPEGGWWLDIALGGHEINLEWRRSRGFGVNARPDAQFGEGNDEVYATLDEAFQRVAALLSHGTGTKGVAEPAPARKDSSRRMPLRGKGSNLDPEVLPDDGHTNAA